jgi:sugar lactone lactonase YvrE
VQDADYAPDGTLAIVRHTESGFAIEMPVGTPLVESTGWITHARVSPDGTKVAYLEHPHTNDDAGDLMVVDVKTRKSRVVAAGWTSIAGVAWDPDGASVWFTAAREHALNILMSARLDGHVRTITQTTGRLRLHDVTADRRAAVTVDAWRLRAMTNEGDRSQSEVSFVSDISADGQAIAIGELGSAETAHGAYLVPVTGSPLRLGPGFPLAISPSGTRVATLVRDGDSARLVVYSTTSGEHPAIETPGHVANARWIDERSLVASSMGQIWRLSLDAKPVALAKAAGKLAIDPARTRCAVVDKQGRLHVIDLATGAARVLEGNFGRRFACGWLAEPDAIVVATLTTPVELVRVDPTSGAEALHLKITPPPLGLKAVDAVVLHSGGQRYAHSYGQELSQLFVMKT